MATRERDNGQIADTRESSSVWFFVGMIVALALLAIGSLVFSANSGPKAVAPVVAEEPVTTN